MCGVFGIYGHPDAIELTYLGLIALQHRGQESAGISVSDGRLIKTLKENGLVRMVFNDLRIGGITDIKEDIPYPISVIGHVRYSTQGSGSRRNAAPHWIPTFQGSMYSLAHNGNIINTAKIIDYFRKKKVNFIGTNDGEALLRLIVYFHLVKKMRSLHDCIREAEKRIIGSYSACMIHEDKLIAFRDPYGIRPLILGQISKNGENYPVIASETCALEAIGAEMVREIVPGEIVMISAQGIESYMPGNSSHNLCAFELVYFSRPDSILGGMAVDEARENMGRVLAKEWPATADYVIAIPDSGNDAALGYHEESGIPFKFGFVRNRYIGRTFIDPEEKLREFLVQMKLSPIKHRLKGKRLVVVDDSIVRGTTSKKIVRTLKEDVGVKEVHLRIASPPKKFPCPLGEDTPEKKKLIAGEKDIEAIRQYVGCESLGYLSMEGLLKAIGRDQKCNYCVGCFSGKYPMPIERIPPKTEGEE